MNHSTTPVGQSATVSSGREPLPPWLQTIYLYLVVAIMMAVRPRPSIRFVVSAFLAYVCYHSSVGCSRATATSDSLGAYSWGAAFAIVLLAVPLFLWLDDPMKWRYRNEAAAPETYPLWKRIHYALCIIWNFRSIGWSTQVDNVPPPATKSRADFLRQAIVAWAKAVLVADLAQTYIQCQPLFELQGTPAFPTGLRGYLISCACLFAYGSKAYANLRVRYISLAIVCVATGLPGTGDPEMWPDSNGKWSDAYTVRRFWGTFDGTSPHAARRSRPRSRSRKGRTRPRTRSCTPRSSSPACSTVSATSRSAQASASRCPSSSRTPPPSPSRTPSSPSRATSGSAPITSPQPKRRGRKRRGRRGAGCGSSGTPGYSCGSRTPCDCSCGGPFPSGWGRPDQTSCHFRSCRRLRPTLYSTS